MMFPRLLTSFGHTIPKLNRFTKKTDPDRLVKVKIEHDRVNVRRALDASEGYVLCGIIAHGILQLLSLSIITEKDRNNFRYLRTPSKQAPSVATVAEYLRKSFFRCLADEPDLEISHIIKMKTELKSEHFYFKEVS